MSIKTGSFNWYIEEGVTDHFLKSLCDAVIYADDANSRILRQMFPHISLAKKEPDWDNDPKVNYKIVSNEFTGTTVPEKTGNMKFPSGSFNRYLHFSGSFVSAMSRVILFSDAENIEIIRKGYPQMIAAFESEWDMCPDGFDSSTYNANKKIEESS